MQSIATRGPTKIMTTPALIVDHSGAPPASPASQTTTPCQTPLSARIKVINATQYHGDAGIDPLLDAKYKKCAPQLRLPGGVNEGLASFAAAIALGALAMDFASPTDASAQPATTIWVPCQYPNGWSSTDASRDVNGIPQGRDHLCAVQYRAPGVILAPCADREIYSSINWTRVFFGTPVRVEYQCPLH